MKNLVALSSVQNKNINFAIEKIILRGIQVNYGWIITKIKSKIKDHEENNQ